jgi:hypothetical protein
MIVAKLNPVGTPGEVSGIRLTSSAIVLGFVSPTLSGGDRGSAASLPSPSPFSTLRLRRLDGVHFATPHAKEDLQLGERPYLLGRSGEPHQLFAASA